MVETVNITPSPRVLRMLGQIDFSPWQCLAELIDNSIDAFLEARLDGEPVGSPRVVIELPNESSLKDGLGVITVRDNGNGMTQAQLENAVRAGYSGNDPVDKMGLFGMGFNISTARLGKRTEVWTTTSESGEWIGIVIDFDDLEKSKSFSAPLLRKDKTPEELGSSTRGTSITVSKLEPERVRTLTFGAGKGSVRRRLGKIYGKVMRDLGVDISYGGDVISPWRHCTWDEKRSVMTETFGNVPAIKHIDEVLPPRMFCSTCWAWLSDETSCPVCGLPDNVTSRKRTIKGWIGIQRYFDKQHYGIDLIRNGRVIDELDKSMFSFVDENHESSLEYPIDATHWGGRIVGELEIDFVRVSHQKDAFDKLDPEWKEVLNRIRGESPLRPNIAKGMGLPVNASPLAAMYSGYRAGYVGLRYLVPGDSTGQGKNSDAVEMAKKFYDNDANYQTDDEWYEMVKRGEAGRKGGNSKGARQAAGTMPGGSTVAGTSGGGETVVQGDSKPVPIQTTFTQDRELTKVFSIESDTVGELSLTVDARITDFSESEHPFRAERSNYKVVFEYDPDHTFFESSLETPTDCLLSELPFHFISMAGTTPKEWPMAVIERELRKKYFPETMTDVSATSETAGALLKELRQHLADTIPEMAGSSNDSLETDILKHIKEKALSEDLLGEEQVTKLVEQGGFTKYLDDGHLIRYAVSEPYMILDGKFFSHPYSTVAENLRPVSLAMVTDGLNDIRWLVEEGSGSISKDLTWRLRYARALASLRLMANWRV